MVTGIMETAGKIQPNIGPVFRMAGPTPGQPVIAGIRSAPTGLIVKDRFGKRIGVIFRNGAITMAGATIGAFSIARRR